MVAWPFSDIDLAFHFWIASLQILCAHTTHAQQFNLVFFLLNRFNEAKNVKPIWQNISICSLYMGTNALSSNQNMSFVTNLMGQIETKRKENCFLHASSIEMLFTTFVGYFYFILLIKSQHLSIGLFCHMNGNSFTYLKKKRTNHTQIS